MEHAHLKWKAQTMSDKTFTEQDNEYSDIEKDITSLKTFDLYNDNGDKLFSLDFTKGILYKGSEIIHDFKEPIDKSTFKYRRRHIVRYSPALKEYQPDYVSYVIFANGMEIELKPEFKDKLTKKDKSNFQIEKRDNEMKKDKKKVK